MGDRLIEITARIEQWNIAQYHCDYLADCLNTGVQPEPWEPHVGERAQAKADAERLVATLNDEGLLPVAALVAERAETAQLRKALGACADLVEKMRDEDPMAHLFYRNDEWHTAVQNAIDSAHRRARGGQQ